MIVWSYRLSFCPFPYGVQLFREQQRKGYSGTAREDGLTSGKDIAADHAWGDLLTAAQQGDSSAYRLFLTSIIPFLHSVVRKPGLSREEAEDVVQDTLLTIHRVRHTFEPGRPVKPWLTAIAARRGVDAMRRRGRIDAQEVSNDLAYETFADPQANKLEDGDSARELARILDGLSSGQKEALELVKLRELSLAEASVVSGQSVASLKVNIHRAIKKMRLKLANRE